MKSEIAKQIKKCNNIRKINSVIKLIPKKDYYSYKTELINIFITVVENELDKDLKYFFKYICVMTISKKGKLITRELEFCLNYIVKRKAIALKELFEIYEKDNNIKAIKDIYNYLVKLENDKQKLYDYAIANYDKIINSIKRNKK